MGGVQFAAGIAIAYYTLRKQHNESVAQRDGEWFHLVVADKTIEELHGLVEGEAVALDSAAKRCQALKMSGSAGVIIDQTFRDEIQRFRERIAPIRRKVSNFAFIFDRDLYLEVTKQFQDLEDKVAEWFDLLQREGPLDRRQGLMEIVCDCQRDLLRSFRDFEFVTLPSLGRQSQPKLLMEARGLFIAGITLGVVAFLFRISHAVLAVTFLNRSSTITMEHGPFWACSACAVLMLGAGSMRRNRIPLQS
jgi:hypothetical protein